MQRCSIQQVAEYGYEPKKVIAEFEDIRYLARKREALEIGIDVIQNNLSTLKQQDYSLRHAINLHSENLSVYNELANIGFGSKELIRLLRTILVIMNSNVKMLPNMLTHWI